MDWVRFTDYLTPLVLSLTMIAASWTLQGWILVKPRQKKDIGESILRASKFFWIGVVLLVVIITIINQLVFYKVLK